VAGGQLRLETVSLDRIMQDIFADLPILRQIAVILIVTPLLPVRAHPNSLRQVQENLLLNAIKFARPNEKPHLKIWTDAIDSMVRVSIQDNGIGIRPEDKERVFGIFERVNPRVEGTGIGLAIVKRSIEKMAGRVGVDSRLNEGSTFWFELPKV